MLISFEERNAVLNAQDDIVRFVKIVLQETEVSNFRQREIKHAINTLVSLEQLLNGKEELPYFVFCSNFLMKLFDPYLSDIDKHAPAD